MKHPKTMLREALQRAGGRYHHVAELRRLERAPWGSEEEMDRLRLTLLRESVARAAEKSPFYRDLLGHAPGPIESLDDLASLPVTTKDAVRGSGLDRATPGTLFRRRTAWKTSGSSGDPYVYGIDLWYGDRHMAQRAWIYLQAGLQRGDRIVEIVPGAGCIAGPDRTYPSFDRLRIGRLETIDDRLRAIREHRPRLLYGNRSHLLEVADAVEASGEPLAIPFIANSSETLHPGDEAYLRRVFRSAVFEVYGSSEAGNLAYRLDGERTWTILEPRVIIEVLDDERQPVAPGEVGEIVVTTLTEKTSPLIRYATADLARVATGSGGGRSGLRLAALEGRTDDLLLDSDGNRVSFWTVAAADLWAAPEVIGHVARWQLHQRADRSIRTRIELTRDGSIEAVEGRIRDHIRAALGDVAVDVEVADRLHEPNAGKFRAVTSEAVRAR